LDEIFQTTQDFLLVFPKKSLAKTEKSKQKENHENCEEKYKDPIADPIDIFAGVRRLSA